MKKIICVFCFLCSLPAFSQTKYYYNSKGDKVYLEQNRNKVWVEYTTLYGSSKSSSMPTTDSVSIEVVNSETFSLSAKAGQQNVDNVSYVFESSLGNIQIPNNKIFVKPKRGFSVEDIMATAGLSRSLFHRIEVLAYPDSLYILHCYDSVDVFDCSILLYQTKKCFFAEPAFKRLITVSNPYYPQQWGLKNTGQNGGTSGMDIRVDKHGILQKGTLP